MPHSFSISFVVEMLVHKHDIKGALVVNHIIGTFLHEREGILEFKDNRRKHSIILLIGRFLDLLSKPDGELRVVDALQLLEATLRKLKEESPVACAHIKDIRLTFISVLDLWVLLG